MYVLVFAGRFDLIVMGHFAEDFQRVLFVVRRFFGIGQEMIFFPQFDKIPGVSGAWKTANQEGERKCVLCGDALRKAPDTSAQSVRSSVCEVIPVIVGVHFLSASSNRKIRIDPVATEKNPSGVRPRPRHLAHVFSPTISVNAPVESPVSPRRRETQ